MAIHAKTTEPVFLPHNGDSSTLITWVKDQMAKAGFTKSEISFSEYDNSGSGPYGRNILYKNKKLGRIMSYSDTAYSCWLEMVAVKGPNDSGFVIFNQSQYVKTNPMDQPPYIIGFSYIDGEDVSRSNRKTAYNSDYTTLVSVESFNPIVPALGKEETTGVYASNHFDRVGIWDEVLRTNIQCDLLKHYIIDDVEYVCISGNPEYQGGVLAKLTTEAATV